MPLSLYVHFPFCRVKCHYCDFYKELHQEKLERKFFEALITETGLAAQKLADSFPTIETIFIGGGTPSLANLELFGRWLETIRKYFEVPNGIEFSVECNPESTTPETLKQFKELGVNRPTYGIQSFNNRMLKLLGRQHNPYNSRKAVYYTNALGYKQFGVDLIFGIPTQTSKMLNDDMDQLIDLEPPHISFYQLTIEPGTLMGNRLARGEIQMPEQELLLAMYRGGCERMAEAGFVRYEVSSFAKPGFECRHNIGYWDGREYLGLGPSAHSFINEKRFYNCSSLQEYVARLDKRELPREYDISGREERMTEAILLGLRTKWGVSRAQFSQRFDTALEERLNHAEYETLLTSGHIEDDKEHLKLTEQGLWLADEITKRLLR